MCGSYISGMPEQISPACRGAPRADAQKCGPRVTGARKKVGQSRERGSGPPVLVYQLLVYQRHQTPRDAHKKQ